MNFSIVVPKKKINKGKRSAGGSDFWKAFWEKEINIENREHYSRMFSRRLKEIDKTVQKIKKESKTDEQLLYVEVKLDDLATSKSNSPTDVWTETGLEIVGAKDDKTIIVSGKIEDFDRLTNISSGGTFDSALTGENIRRKDKNLLRELYAMSGIKDRNAIVEGRVSNYIYSLVHKNVLDDVIECIVEIYSNIGKDKYDKLFDFLDKQTNLKGKFAKRNKNLFFSNASFLASLTGNEIIDILSDTNFNFISKIREQPILSSQRCIPEINLGSLKLLKPLTDEKVGLIDSGIYNTTLLNLRTHHHNYLSSHQKEDEHHGTTVASRILFGDSFFIQLAGGTSSIAPTCNILDIQVLYLDGDRSRCISLDELETAISEVVNRYKDVSIYNLSISENAPTDKDDISELTEFLDNIARQYDVIFVCSVGNQKVFASQNYSDIFKQDESVIASPSDAHNVISVGSVSNKVDPNCITTEQGFPSPFTRTSGLQKNIKKPELVANGGNVKKDLTMVYGDSHMIASSKVFGVESINKDGLYKDIGTSLSAPLITRECVFLLDFIKKAKTSEYIDLDKNKFNLVKALLIHSTAKTSQVQIADDYVKRAYGFGVPNHNLVLRDDTNELTLMYADKINLVDKKHKLQIHLPKSLLGKKAEFIFTLVYNPPVDKNYPKEYKMMTIEPGVRFIVPRLDEEGEIENKTSSLTGAPSWDHYRNPNHSVIHFKKTRREVPSTVLEVLLQLSATQPYESKIIGKESSEEQPYAFILTVRDLSNSDKFREEIIKVNEFQELVQVQTEDQITI